MPKVVVYTRTTCGPCKTIKYFLNKKGIPYEEMNIDDDPVAAREFSELTNVPMVPLVRVGDQQFQGMNISLLSKLLTA